VVVDDQPAGRARLQAGRLYVQDALSLRALD